MNRIDGLVQEYLDICESEKALVTEKRFLKDAIAAQLNIGVNSEPGQVWEFTDVGRVEVCKGRTAVVLDRAKLVRQGVTAEILDAATSTTTGQPSVRITRYKEEA